MSKSFKFAGVSRINGVLKVRFSDRDIYAKALVKANNTDVEIVDLGAEMTKEQAIEHLINTDFAQGRNEVLDALTAAADKRAPKLAREAARARGEIVKRGRKPKAKPEAAPIEVPAELVAEAQAELEDAPF